VKNDENCCWKIRGQLAQQFAQRVETTGGGADRNDIVMIHALSQVAVSSTPEFLRVFLLH
jgi:hypothetical protein